MLKRRSPLLIFTFLAILFLQACSGNDFHLRKNVDLPIDYQKIKLENISYENNFVKIFEEILEESGGKLVSDSVSTSTTIRINNFREGKRIIAFTKDRKAREFLLSLKFDYTIKPTKKRVLSNKNYRINLDRVFIYDANFALGKEEEETKIKKNLYREAARLILLKLQYNKD